MARPKPRYLTHLPFRTVPLLEREVWTSHEAADYLRVPHSTVRELVNAGKLPGWRVGKAIRFYRRDLMNMRMLAVSGAARPVHPDLPSIKTRHRKMNVTGTAELLADDTLRVEVKDLQQVTPGGPMKLLRALAPLIAVLVALSGGLADAATWTHEIRCEVPPDPTATHLTLWKESVSSGKRTLDRMVPIDWEAQPTGTPVPFLVKKPSATAGKWNYYCGSYREANEETGALESHAIKEDAYAGINWKIKPEGQ